MAGVSIIIPAWKTSDFIGSSLESIYNQTWIQAGGEYEILVGIDSCYDTLITAQNAANNHTSIYWFPEHAGAYVIRNTLIKKAKYDHLLMFDSDDQAHPDLLKNSFVYPDHLVRYGFLTSLGNANKTWGIHFMPKSLYEKYGGYQAWECDADANFINRVHAGKDKSVLLDNLNYIIRGEHPNQLTRMNTTGMYSALRGGYKKQTEEQIQSNNLCILEPVTAKCLECNGPDDIMAKSEYFISNSQFIKEHGPSFKGKTQVIACAAWQSGCPHREASMSFVTKQYEAQGILVYLGTADGETFNRGAARNAAVAQGLQENPDAEVIILYDTDTYVTPTQVWLAAYTAKKINNVVYAFENWCPLTPEATNEFIAGLTKQPRIQSSLEGSVGGVIAIPTALWKEFKGYDERFKSWGGEDRALFYVCAGITGKQDYTRVKGNALHFYHPKSPETSKRTPQYSFNQSLAARYKQAAGRYDAEGFTLQIADGGFKEPKKDELIAILAEEGGPLSDAAPKGRVCTEKEAQAMEMIKYRKRETGKILFMVQDDATHKRVQAMGKDWEQII